MNGQDKHETKSIVIIDVEMEGNALYATKRNLDAFIFIETPFRVLEGPAAHADLQIPQCCHARRGLKGKRHQFARKNKEREREGREVDSTFLHFLFKDIFT